jgi:chromosome partitioning protein
MIISFLNQKGGVGKTTLAVNVADHLHLQGKRVLLIDSDPQGSSLDWASMRNYEDGFSVIGLPKPTLHKEVKNFSGDYDYIIIDGPPRSYDVARSTLMASELVLIPVQPSPYDIWATDEVVKLIDECSSFNENMKCAFVINRKITNTAIGRDVKDAFEDRSIPVLKNNICQRVVYAETAAQGGSVCRSAHDGVAAKEIEKLTQEILEIKA